MGQDFAIDVRNLSRIYTYHRKAPGLSGSIKAFFRREIVENVAVKQISFEVQEGELIGFIGPNGAGKTTTMKMLSGVLYPTSGTAKVLGFTPHNRKNEYLRKIAFVMGQKGSLFWELPAMELFLLTRDMYEIPETLFRDSLAYLSELLKAEDFLDIQVRKLSLGQRMKCELIAGLLHMPRVLFLDEPTIGLDVAAQKMIRDFLCKYNEEMKATVLLTSHNLEDIRSLCRRIIFINKGSIIYDGSIEELVHRYAPDMHLTFIFADRVDSKALTQLAAMGQLENEEEQFKIHMRVKRDDAVEVSRVVLNRFSVSDLFIQEPPLLEAVAHMWHGVEDVS